MDGTSEEQRKRLAAVWKAVCATKYVKNDVAPCQIEKGVYLGSFGAATNIHALKSENVTHILTVASSLRPVYPSNFVYKMIEIRDSEDADISQYFDECLNFIEEAKRAGGGVLIHCFAGISRSVTIVVAYLMKTYKMSLPTALAYVREKRSIACPNPGFMTLLQNYEKSLQGEIIDSKQEV